MNYRPGDLVFLAYRGPCYTNRTDAQRLTEAQSERETEIMSHMSRLDPITSKELQAITELSQSHVDNTLRLLSVRGKIVSLGTKPKRWLLA